MIACPKGPGKCPFWCWSYGCLEGFDDEDEPMTNLAAENRALRGELGYARTWIASTVRHPQTEAMLRRLDAALASEPASEDADLRTLLTEARPHVARAMIPYRVGWIEEKVDMIYRIDAALAVEPASGKANDAGFSKEWVDRFMQDDSGLPSRVTPPPPPTQGEGTFAIQEQDERGQTFYPLPTQGDEEKARSIIDEWITKKQGGHILVEIIAATLRQARDEAAEAMRAECERIVLSRMNDADGSIHLSCMNDVRSAIAALKDKT